MSGSVALTAKNTPSPGTVGRGKTVTLDSLSTHTHWTGGQVSLQLGDSLNHYAQWDTPTVIVSDGAYGILGFEGDTSDHLGIADWYEPHIQVWSQQATAQTTFWFWNSEIGWATVGNSRRAGGLGSEVDGRDWVTILTKSLVSTTTCSYK